MTAVVATLFERGHYEVGVAALLNSLIRSGFRGRVWCGIRGVTPAWLEPQRVSECAHGKLAVVTVNLDTERHLALYKPHFMMQVAQEEAAATSVVYLDPDIVVKCDWAFLERWCNRGIAAIADNGPSMPASSPERLDWRDFRAQISPAFDETRARPLDFYCNSGFVGVNRRCDAYLTKRLQGVPLKPWRCAARDTEIGSSIRKCSILR
jgi:hypothetical protein